MNYRAIHQTIQALANEKNAVTLSRFFKTGKGEYGEGDRFLGIKAPEQKKVAQQFSGLELAILEKLLKSPFNEERAIALAILNHQYEKGDEKAKVKIYKFYLDNLIGVNNWNLVDGSAPYIVGAHLLKRERTLLHKLVRSQILWERRIAIVATWWFIRNDDFEETLQLSSQLLDDPQDLMHKACGWMLREVGKRDLTVLDGFLSEYSTQMPRTMLRYAIEKFPEKKRKAILKRK